jgi:hypothetical protein
VKTVRKNITTLNLSDVLKQLPKGDSSRTDVKAWFKNIPKVNEKRKFSICLRQNFSERLFQLTDFQRQL